MRCTVVYLGNSDSDRQKGGHSFGSSRGFNYFYLVLRSRGSTDVVNLPVFERGSLEASKMKDWYRDDVPLSEWEGVTANKKNEVS